MAFVAERSLHALRLVEMTEVEAVMSSIVERSALPLGSAKTSHEISPRAPLSRDDTCWLLSRNDWKVFVMSTAVETSRSSDATYPSSARTFPATYPSPARICHVDRSGDISYL